MVRFDSVLNVSDLIRDAILLLLQQVDRHRPRVVGLQQFHALVVEPVALTRKPRKLFCLVRHEQVEVSVDLSSEVLPHAG
ncbi:hypothetical protein [Leucobacter triazinivorans]|uniref:hypothetical protein n=1 Tax=Leucobacter triazinivorans TaxID=1784719 RepID=UPI001F0D2810|nr:hypothetical protein [Leucobacter triazinivorans]